MKRPIFLYILAVLLPIIGWAQERQMLSLPNREQPVLIFLALWTTGSWKYWKLWAKGKFKD